MLHEHNTAARDLLFRHLTGDWGDLCDEDRQLNDQALKTGARLVSAYHLGADKLWVVTEGAGDRRMTTILRPDEY